jgi:hypothetical protein
LERTLSTTGEIELSGSPQSEAVAAIETNFPDLLPDSDETRTRIAQMYGLNTMFYALNGSAWKLRDDWASAVDFCGDSAWYGVECNADLIVTRLNLTDNDLMGSIPSEIKGLSGLGKFLCCKNTWLVANACFTESLDMANNRITGTLPASIGDMESLQRLDYSNNFINDTLPATIGNLEALTTLKLSTNGHSGTMPTEIGRLRNLLEIDMGSNKFSGVIPTEIGNLTSIGKSDDRNLLLLSSNTSSQKPLISVETCFLGRFRLKLAG